jgi:hypothetical protein
MNNLKTFESFASEIFGLPFFLEVTDEEDEKISDALYKGLGEFEDNYFDMDEPSLGLKEAQEEYDSEVRADYWLANPTVEYLNILDKTEMDNLKAAHPNKTHVSSVGGREWKWPVIYGTFIWYSIKPPRKEPGMTKTPEREHRIWMIAKDDEGSFKAIDARYFPNKEKNPELRSALNTAKSWENLDALLESQIPHLKSIGKYVQEHCRNEYDEKEEIRIEAESEGDPNDGLEPWR